VIREAHRRLAVASDSTRGWGTRKNYTVPPLGHAVAIRVAVTPGGADRSVVPRMRDQATYQAAYQAA
jgi:hypothetical protein